MYFNEQSKSTNIDKSFNKNNTNIDIKKYLKWIILVLGILILFIVIFILIRNNSVYNFELLGSKEIVIYQNSEYVDEGYIVYNYKNKDITSKSKVSTTGEVDTSTIGDYVITYKYKNKEISRNISVISKNTQSTFIILKGESTMYLHIGDTYTEPGFNVFDYNETNLESLVKVTGSVNTKEAGTYILNYVLNKSNGITVTAKRTVIVKDSSFTLTLSNTAKTNKSITINFSTKDNYFSYIILPNGEKSTKRSITYEVSKNGTYKFIAYDSMNEYTEKSIEVTNIDTIAPNITSCKCTINSDGTNIEITTNDTDISKYIINNKYEFTEKSKTISDILDSATLKAADDAGNTTTKECTIEITYDKPIDPTGSENIVKKEYTTTLRVWMEKKTRGSRTPYYVTHIWAQSPYKQLKSGLPNKFGAELLRPQKLLDIAISKNNLQNKLAVAVNGSGFVVKGTFDTGLANANSSWNKTSVTPIVISEGNVLRDFASSYIPSSSHYVYGLKKDGYLAAYKYTKGTNSDSNLAISKQIKSDGVLNTWGFNPILVENGTVKSTSTSHNIRQGLCQIDRNNFVLITDIYDSQRSGFSFKELGAYMVSLGCKTGFNLDGGGSTSLIFKSKSSTTTEIITGNNRNVADILYFHE